MATPLTLDAIRPDYWGSLAFLVALVVAGLWWARRLRSPWRRLVRTVVVLLVAREVLLDNPLVWQLYSAKLTADDVGWRQESVISYRRDGYLRHGVPPRYLAVGSSQTDRIYGEFSRSHEDLGTFILAGMTPIDMFLYRSQILRRSSDCVLLYVSDFDLARKPPENAIVTSPRQGFVLWETWRTLRAVPMGREYDAPMAELLLGEFFPEAKYGFVLRGCVDVVRRRLAERMGKVDPPQASVDLDQRVTWLRESFDDRYLELNSRFLEKFVAVLARDGRRVVLVEGQYSPLVHDEQSEQRSRRARELLRTLSERFEEVVFIASDEILSRVDVEFDDLTHVTEETAQRMVRSLLAKLEGRPPPPRFNPAVEPVPRDSSWWSDRVQQLRDRVRGASDVGIVFLGDSITRGWETDGAEVWQRFYARHGGLQLGVGGDGTQHLLWRLRDTPLGHLRPDVVVVLIGTNNTVRKSLSAADIAAGIEAVVNEVRTQLPAARVLLLGLLPRDAAADPIRDKISGINARIQNLDDGNAIRFLDFGAAFVDSTDEVRADLMPDRLHLSARGYEVWAEAMGDVLADWLNPR